MTSPPVLSASAVSARTPTHQIIRSADIKAEAGAVVSVVGANGSGKSTLLRALAGLPPLHGVTVQGSIERPPRIAFVHQQYYSSLLPWYRAEANIRMPARFTAASEQHDLIAVMRDLGLGGRVPLDRYPDQLSGGQRQMVAIARAFFVVRDVILLDEPFSGLDIQAQDQVASGIRRFARTHGVSIVIVLHDLLWACAISDVCIPLAGSPSYTAEPIHIDDERPDDLGQFMTSPRVLALAGVAAQRMREGS